MWTCTCSLTPVRWCYTTQPDPHQPHPLARVLSLYTLLPLACCAVHCSVSPHSLFLFCFFGDVSLTFFLSPSLSVSCFVSLFLPPGGSPTDQFSGMINYLAGFGIYNNSTSPHAFGTVWLDIEAPDLWSSDQSVNRNFVQAMIDEAQRLGVRLGIYTSASQWIPIMGEWDGGSSFPLWYAHYDDNPSFSDFSPFGGWSSPSIKQYEGNLDVCGASIDADWCVWCVCHPLPSPRSTCHCFRFPFLLFCVFVCCCCCCCWGCCWSCLLLWLGVCFVRCVTPAGPQCFGLPVVVCVGL